VVATTGAGDTSLPICDTLSDTDPVKVRRAALLAMSKFIGHIKPSPEQEGPGTVWLARVRVLAWNGYDETTLLDVLQKCAQELVEPSRHQAQVELTKSSLWRAGGCIVCCRDRHLRSSRMRISGCPCCWLIFARRHNAQSTDRFLARDDYRAEYNHILSRSYRSLLAAASLQDIGLLNATDVSGVFDPWK
jgi:hypothetical protein